MDSVEYKGIVYEWLGQSTVRMTTADGYVIYTDPVFLDKDPATADLILITHHHVDHCLPEYVAAIRAEKTDMAAFHASYVKHCTQDIKGVHALKIGSSVSFGQVSITAVEAYTKKGFHTKGEGCGFLIELSGEKQEAQRIYFSGDTALIDEMKTLGHVDVAMLSICDNVYAIDTDESIEAIKTLKPALFIPVHFTPPSEPDPVPREGMFSTKDPRFFTRKEDPERLVKPLAGSGVEVAILKKIGKQFEGSE
jgi:L-ascorbate metabolism protein UlaG (beta-lactamase superfamily)